MNNRKVLAGRIRQLSDEELKVLLQLGSERNPQIIAIAKQEAGQRGISLEEIELQVPNSNEKKKEHDDWLFTILNFLTR